MSMGDGQSHMMMTPERIEAFYKAQCLKDDTMAESIVEFLKEHKDTKVLHVQGSFHGDEHLGVVEKVNKLNPSLKTVVITPIEAKDYEKMKHNYGEDTIIMTFVRNNIRIFIYKSACFMQVLFYCCHFAAVFI